MNPNLILKPCELLAITTTYGRGFHSLTMHHVKQYFILSVPLCSFTEWPWILILWERGGNLYLPTVFKRSITLSASIMVPLSAPYQSICSACKRSQVQALAPPGRAGRDFGLKVWWAAAYWCRDNTEQGRPLASICLLSKAKVLAIVTCPQRQIYSTFAALFPALCNIPFQVKQLEACTMFQVWLHHRFW